MKVNFFNQTNEDTLNYEKIILKALSNEKNEKTIEIIFVDNELMQQMNNYYRQINRPTDVLSFINDDLEDTSLGDVFINVEQAKKQAQEYQHSIEREIAFLAVHGYLHLIGYDHETKEDEEIMFSLQEKILNKANIERK